MGRKIKKLSTIKRNSRNPDVFKPLPKLCFVGKPMGDIYPDKEEKKMLVQNFISEYKEMTQQRKKFEEVHLTVEDYLNIKRYKYKNV